MIRVETAREGQVRDMKCRIKGTPAELVEDTLFALRQIWTQIGKESPFLAAAFAAHITDAVNGRCGVNPWAPNEYTVEFGIKTATKEEEAGPS